MKPMHESQLYAFVAITYLRGRAPGLVAQPLCDGGADLIRLRAKESTTDEIRRLTRSILPSARRAEISPVINPHPSLAYELGAEFCHLGQGNFFGAGYTPVHQLAAVMKVGRAGWCGHAFMTRIQIDLSTRAPEQARQAAAAGADCLGAGPSVSHRHQTIPPARYSGVSPPGCGEPAPPRFAIGGTTLDHLDDVFAAGAQHICAVSAILCTPDLAPGNSQFQCARIGIAGRTSAN